MNTNFIPTRFSLSHQSTWLWRGLVLLLGIWLVGSAFTPSLVAQDTEWTLKPLPANVSYLDNLYFIDDETGWAVGYADDPGGAIILKTTNAGEDWTTQLTALDSEIISLHMADANTGYAVGMQAYKTTNGGTDWVEQTVHDEVWETLSDVFCISETTAIAVGQDMQHNQSLIYRTTDGASWAQPTYPAIAFGQLNAVTFVDAAHGWAVGSKESSSRPLILHSADGGATWAEQPNPATAGELRRVFFVNTLNGWAVGGTGDDPGDSVVFLQTSDGGATWTAGNAPPGTMAQSVHMISASEGYVVVNESGSGGSWSTTLYHIGDDGATWTEALAALAGGYFGNVQIASSSGSLAWGEAGRPGAPLQATQQSRTAFGAGSRNNGPMFGSTSLAGTAPPQLTRIDVTPSSATMHVGNTQLFIAKGYDQNGNEMPITPIWSATGGTITQEGQYTATEPGDFTVTASVEGSEVQGTATVHVDSVPVLSRIDVTPSSCTMHVGDTRLFTAQGFDQNGNEMPITPIWSASGGTITQGGEYRATTEGDFTVTASVEGSEVQGTATVHVDSVPVLSRIDVLPSSVTMNVGGTKIFNAQGFDQNGNEIPITPNWSASGGTITEGGQYTATEPGDFTVTASVEGSEVQGTATVHVDSVPVLSRIDVTPSSCTMHVGDTRLFTAQGFDQNGNEMPITPIWSATGGAITQEGQYTATEPGDFTVTASVEGSEVQGTTTVHVDPVPVLSRIDVLPSSMTMNVGEIQLFTAQGFDQNDNPVPITPIWSATGGAITQEGQYTATEPGDFTVTASVESSEVQGTATVHVDPVPVLSRIDVLPSSMTMNVGEIQLFTAKGFDQNDNPIPITPIWSATGGAITQEGQYTATEPGDFTVTASVESSEVQGTATVHVDPAPVLAHIVITPSSSTIHVGDTQIFAAKGYDQNGNEMPITPNWSATGGAITPGGGIRATVTATETQQIDYTAGNLPGHYRVTAAVGEIESRARVTILGAAPPDLVPGASYEHTFATPGVYPYYDGYDFGLRGTAIVSPTLVARLAPQATTVISITATGFTPFTVTIAISDTVRWVNADAVTHAIRGGEPHTIYLPLVMRP
jgi:plastocyanin